MSKCPFNKWEKEIEKYCVENNLAFEKLKNQVRSWHGEEELDFLYYEKNCGTNGLRDETPLPIVLSVKNDKGNLVFVKTEYTERVLRK